MQESEDPLSLTSGGFSKASSHTERLPGVNNQTQVCSSSKSKSIIWCKKKKKFDYYIYSEHWLVNESLEIDRIT